MLHVVSDVWGTLLQRGLRFVQKRRTRDLVKERDPICAWTNRIAQTPVLKWLSLTQAIPSKPIQTGLALVLDIKTRSLEIFSQYSAFHSWFVYSVCKYRMPSPARLFKRFREAGTNESLDLNLSWRASEDPLKRPCKI